MARYRRPPDPRKAAPELTRPGHAEESSERSEPFPWLWLGLGVLVTIMGLALAAGLAAAFLSREPLAVTLPTATIIRLTAPPSAIPSATSPLPTPTQFPTFTPPPTPDLSIAPETVMVGFYARVANTDNIGVSLRGGPSTDNVRLELVPEGTLLLVIGGPEQDSDFIWWQVRRDDGTEGWIAGDFLVPSARADGEGEG